MIVKVLLRVLIQYSLHHDQALGVIAQLHCPPPVALYSLFRPTANAFPMETQKVLEKYYFWA